MQISIFGLGYVGAVSAACLAELGHRVIGVDLDAHKVNSILAAKPPFYEPGLDKLIASNVAAGRLSATSSAADALRESDVAFVCVGTPSERNGNLSLEQVRRVVASIAESLGKRTKPLVLAIRSTVFPGTCEEVVMPLVEKHPEVSVVSNPEFMREGVAVRDFMEPSLIVVGGQKREAVQRVADIYAPLQVEASLVSLRTAEMIKYACNAFHAVKIAFANEIDALSGRLGVDGIEVMDTLCRDKKLNVSKAYLKPGFAFGGSCLPKDLRALVYRGRRLDLTLPLLESALPSNDAQLDRGIEAVLESNARRIGVLGLAFKEDTDDLRESPVVSLLEHLIGKGRDIRVYDPHIQLDDIYGANRNFILNAIPHIGRLMQSSADGVLSWADQIVIAQKLPAELASRVENLAVPIIDLVKTGQVRSGKALPVAVES